MNMTDKEVEKWYDMCSKCKKQKPNMSKARCQLYHAICISRSQTAIDNIKIFTDKHGQCKNFDPKGDSDGQDNPTGKTPKWGAPKNW